MDSRVKHGGYRPLGRLDWRSREARFVGEVEAELITTLGGEPTVQECLLIRRAAVKSMRLALMESKLLKSDSDVPEALGKNYLRWSRELREDLKILGLQRRAKPIQDLDAYLSEKYG